MQTNTRKIIFSKSRQKMARGKVSLWLDSWIYIQSLAVVAWQAETRAFSKSNATQRNIRIWLGESKTVSLETTRIWNAPHRIRAKQGRNLHAPAASSDGGWSRWRGWRQGRPWPGCGRRYNASQLWWWMGHGAFLHYAFIIFVCFSESSRASLSL